MTDKKTTTKPMTSAVPQRQSRTGLRVAYAGWSDETVPDLSVILRPLRIEQSAIDPWLKARLARHRNTRAYLDSLPTLAQERALLSELIAHLASVRDSLQPDALPPGIVTRLGYLLVQHQVDWHGLSRRLRSDVTTLWGALAAVDLQMTEVEGKPGRPAAQTHELFRELVDVLTKFAPKASASAVREVAADVIRACIPHADVPVDARSQRRALQRTGQKS